ncbi:hypothetical protein BKA58DRAFT_459636 [Alternaria rosae]|uniref:uncharacterized protein n=1 Tax=Alternaria rosae TaxID=1187941 RepID=UPI001E8DABF4|nr:uncharacterized protein BKA58DRAFT_459636 [Alternaria rosae]KAH6868702.1 hypothetical protein BKA58DRAFT_459636 [Alternaria rosae]
MASSITQSVDIHVVVSCKARSDTDSRLETRQHGRPPHRIVKHLTAPDTHTHRTNNPPVGVRKSVLSCDALRKSNRIAQTPFRYNMSNLIPPRHCDVSYVYIYNNTSSRTGVFPVSFGWGNAVAWIDRAIAGFLYFGSVGVGAVLLYMALMKRDHSLLEIWRECDIVQEGKKEIQYNTTSSSHYVCNHTPCVVYPTPTSRFSPTTSSLRLQCFFKANRHTRRRKQVHLRAMPLPSTHHNPHHLRPITQTPTWKTSLPLRTTRENGFIMLCEQSSRDIINTIT